MGAGEASVRLYDHHNITGLTMPECLFPPGVCISVPACTTTCALKILDAESVTVDPKKIQSTLSTHDVTPKPAS